MGHKGIIHTTQLRLIEISWYLLVTYNIEIHLSRHFPRKKRSQ